MAKKKTDRVSVIGLISAILRNTAQQRALQASREKKQLKVQAKGQPKVKKPKKPKDTRLAEEVGREVASTRVELVDTVAAIKADLSLPTRFRDWRGRTAAKLPAEVKGEPQATLAAAGVLVVGLGTVALSALAGIRLSHRSDR